MEKRLILAIALSLGVLLIWSAMVPKPQTVDSKGVTALNKEIVVPPPPVKERAQEIPKDSDSDLIRLSYGDIEVVFYEKPAALKEVIFKRYGHYRFPLQYGFYLNDPKLVFKKTQTLDGVVIFTAADTKKKVVKKFTFDKSNYTIKLDITVQNLTSQPQKLEFPLLLGVIDLGNNNPQARYQDLTIATQDKVTHASLQKDYQWQGVKFLGFRDQYFAAIIEPEGKSVSCFSTRVNKETSVGLNVQTDNLFPGEQIGHFYRIYIGPQDVNILNNINPAWSALIHFGTFDFISQILLQALGFLYRVVHNWGLAIILLSILIYLFLYPLSIKQMRSMKEMQVLQPKVEELRKLYKDNPQKMNKEIMELYREHKVNPLGGCLPLLLQMPIFFALYNALMRSIVLKGANFLWIKDLSEPDRLIVLPRAIPILGQDLNILPIIMAIGMFVQQKISALSSNSTQAEQQKIMLIVMPVMFGVIFYRMPSGLVLYWFVNSMLMLVFQLRMNKSR